MSLNYVTLGSNDVAKARAFFDAVLPVIGGERTEEHLPHAICYTLRDGGRLWVVSPINEEPATPGNGTMIGLACASPDEVRVAHAAALAASGTDEGAPGPRPQYGPGFYGAYVRDLDGNKISFVHLGDGG